jgi:hypothetical protein
MDVMLAPAAKLRRVSMLLAFIRSAGEYPASRHLDDAGASST